MPNPRKTVQIVLNSKEGIIEQYKRELPLPSYCAANWDSFEECLIDFLDESSAGLIIVHDSKTALSKEDFDTYLSIINAATDSHDVIIEMSEH